MFAALLEVGQIPVRQILDMLTHILARQIDEEGPDAVADATRAAVQHEPHVIALIQAYFDEVIAGAQRAQMIDVVAAVQVGILCL